MKEEEEGGEWRKRVVWGHLAYFEQCVYALVLLYRCFVLKLYKEIQTELLASFSNSFAL